MGADPNVRDDDGDCTPLHLAAKSDPWTTKSIMLMNCLLDKGADINALDEDECTPLLIAVHHGHAASVDTLLHRGADPDIPDWYGRTPLYHAVKPTKVPQLEPTEEHSLCQNNMVNSLLAYGANPNTIGDWPFSPLFTAILDGNSDIANMLLVNGADPNPDMCDESGRTPLNSLVDRYLPLHDIAFARFFLAQGADPNTCSQSGQTTLNFAVGNAEECKKLVEDLLANGANPNKPGELGNTPLHLAIEKDCPEIVNTLLANGAHVDIPNTSGQTALNIATVKKNFAMIDILKNYIPAHQPKTLKSCARTCIRSRLVENRVLLVAALTPDSDWLPLNNDMKAYLYHPLTL